MRRLWSRWLQSEVTLCPVCDSKVNQLSEYERSSIPVRHPGPREVLSTLCKGCRESIPWITASLCRVCGRPEVCGDCERLVTRHYERSRSAVRYDAKMKEVLALYKYRGSEKLEPVLAAMLAFSYEQLQREFIFHGIDLGIGQPIVTAVPLARERLEDRGFNQAERMAVRLANWYGLVYDPLLSRLFHTEKQSLKDRRSRTTDMRGIFTLTSPTSRIGEEVRPTILLVDDIYTTGSTINECARILKQGLSRSSHSPHVYGVLWARS
jgi:competence protein ComFC